jgi:ArsR family transcriptional regulator
VASQLEGHVIEKDRERCDKVLAARDGASWSEMVAGEMERHYSPGRTWESLAKGVIGLVRLGKVLDVGSGDGTVAELLAARSERIVCVDRSPRVIEAARRRLDRLRNVEARVADAHALPFGDGEFDQVLLFHVLDQVERPSAVIAECARVLRDGGGLAALTLDAHAHHDVVAGYGHVNRGFAPRELRRLLQKGGFAVEQCAATTREKRQPHFQVVSAFATKRAGTHEPKEPT